MWRASPRHSIHSVPCATRSQVSTLLEPANCRCMLPCTGYPAPAVRVPGCQVRDGCTTSYDHGARVVSPANG